MGEGGDEQARTLLDEAIALTKEVGDHIAEGAFRGCLGLVLTRQGEPDASRQQFKQALALLEQCGDLVEVGLLHTRIAESALWSDEVVRARRALVQAEATHSQLHPAPQSELSLAIASLKSRLT